MRLVFRLLVLVIFVGLLVGIIAYARGYRLDIKQKSLNSTGILALSSNPKAAKVYINGELKGVTDLNLTLPPGTYSVEIKKDGYTNWSKDLQLRGEIVMSLDAMLFPKNPSLSPLTNLGIVKAIPVDQTDRILLFSQNNDPETDGIYLFDSNQKPISFLPPLKLLLPNTDIPEGVTLKDTSVSFSPDYRQAVFDFVAGENAYSYLVSLDAQTPEPFDVSASRDTLLNAWRQEKNREIMKILETFPKEVQPVASDSFHIIAFSPDETKILYKANKNATIPVVIDPPLIGSNQAQEERNIRKNTLYVYDTKEDKNIVLNDIVLQEPEAKIAPTRSQKSTVNVARYTPSPATRPTSELIPQLDFADDGTYPVLWYPDSRHLVVEQDKDIVVYDYDGSNKRTIYSGPFEPGFFNITTEGKLFILTNLNPQNNTFADLYEIGIR